MNRPGVVTGLAFEAKVIEKAYARAKRPAPLLVCSGPGGARARAAAEKLLTQGATGLISFGICAGLDPGLRPGTLLLADRVIAETGNYEPDPAWRTRFAGALTEMHLPWAEGAVAGRDELVAKAEEKSALFRDTAARAVDMESHGVGQAAEAAGVPFLVLRALADPAERSLPRAALKATGPDGRLRLLSTIMTMYLTPWDGPKLVRLAFDTRLALDSLEKAADPERGLLGGD